MHSITLFVVGLFAAICRCSALLGGSFKACKNKRINLPFVNSVRARSTIECAVACMSDILCGSSNYIKNNQACDMLTDSFQNEQCDEFESHTSAVVLKKNRPQCIHGGTWNPTVQNCGTCDQGYAGRICERHIIDCHEGNMNGQSGTANVLIQPIKAPAPFLARCHLSAGITEVERRGGCSSYGDFDQNWATYKQGFGDLNCNHFIGLEHLYLLTNQRASLLKVQSRGTTNHQAYYWNLRIGNEASQYTMHYTRYTPGSDRGGDGFGMLDPTASINGTIFCTPDRDCNTCAQTSNSGWWFNSNCATINLHVKDETQMKWPLDEFDYTTERITSFYLFLSEQW